MPAPPPRLHLGVDLSTQQLKGVVVDAAEQRPIASAAVNFQELGARFGLHEGQVVREDDEGVVTQPVALFLAAFDLFLQRLSQSVPLEEIAALSGCGQQHGTVYWNTEGPALLANLDPAVSFEDGLKNSFSRSECPIWMDSSTTEQCRRLEEALGGAIALAEVSGSRAFHRFSGPQIAKIYEKEPATFAATSRISLVSSFAASLFLGEIAPWDLSDASGANLLDVRLQTWDERCLKAVAGEESKTLREKLGEPVITDTVLVSDFSLRESLKGRVSSFLVRRFGFSPDCKVVAFTGDNPASLAGLGLREGDVAVSLGTSDTLFVNSRVFSAHIHGHVFVHPTEKDHFMGMVCFKNGSLTRERIRRATGTADWHEFSQMLAKTPPGNEGQLGFYFDHDEIAPNVRKGDFRFSASGSRVTSFPREVEARAVLEQQCLAKRLYAQRLGIRLGEKGRLILTGGASVNVDLRQMLADVFKREVYVATVADSAALGGALRAAYGSFSDWVRVPVERVASPNPQASAVYDSLIIPYEQLEEQICV